MTHLLRLTLLLIVACVAAIFTAHLIGSTRPNPLAMLFTNPDGTPCQRPCLLGVRPGETKYEDAVAILQTHPAVQKLSPQRNNGLGANRIEFIGDAVTISARADDHKRTGMVSMRVNISNLEIKPESVLDHDALGQLIGYLGKPTFIAIGRWNTAVFYNADLLIAHIGQQDSDTIGANDMLLSITLYSAVDYADFLNPDNELRVWRGFASVNHYLSYPLAVQRHLGMIDVRINESLSEHRHTNPRAGWRVPGSR